MPYKKRISRANPGLIAFVLDDSGSMKDSLPGTSDPKYAWTSRYFGVILKELTVRSTEMKGDQFEIKPRYFTTVILYGGAPQFWGTPGMDIQATVEKYTQAGNTLGLGGQLGGTDTAAAFRMTFDYLSQAVRDERFKDSFPPTLFHVTDGMSHTDPTAVADQVKGLSTADGNVLVVNGYIGTQTALRYKGAEDFPGYVDVSEVGSSEDNIRLFNMSSEVPESMRANLIEDGIFPKLRAGARLFFDVRTKDLLKRTLQVIGSMGSRADRLVR